MVKNVTDFEFPRSVYEKNYTHLETKNLPAEFQYTFQFGKYELVYKYIKTDFQTYSYEEVVINDVVLALRNKNKIEILAFEGAEYLSKELSNDKISLIAYLRNNANLDKRKIYNKIFSNFLDFVDGMLFFRSLDVREYIGYDSGVSDIFEYIVKKNKVMELQLFLEKAGIKYHLEASSDDIYCVFGKNKSELHQIMSSGTQTLLLFYYWLLRIKEDKKVVSLLFIDEFDAFYHFELSKAIVEELKTFTGQTILTTHNTSLLSNELLRPDCYFVINNQKIQSLPNLTDREIRAVHNLEKLYKAKAFN
ncbi:ATP-binding protein [Acinetobacter sp. AM]|nr:ATP-binding protein [Acinetobacter sp. AM]